MIKRSVMLGHVMIQEKLSLMVNENLFSSEETKRSNLQALARWALRNTLSPKVGKGRYTMAEYEKVKRIPIPLEVNSHLLLVTTEVNADQSRIIQQVLNLV